MRARQALKKRSGKSDPRSSDTDSPFFFDPAPAPPRLPPGRPLSCLCGTCSKCLHRVDAAKSRYFRSREENEQKSRYQTIRFTPEEDETLRSIYKNIKYENNAAKRSYAALPSRTPSQIFRRVAELGLIRRRERYRWTEEELRVVEANAHLALETIQRRLVGITPFGFKRTRSAIASQIHANRFRTTLDGLNFQQLSDAIGISIDTIRRYQAQKMIRGKKIPSIDQHKGKETREGVKWFFPNYEIFMFILRHPGMIDLRRVNQDWFLSLVEWGSRYDSDSGKIVGNRSRNRKSS